MTKAKYILVFLLLILAIFTYKILNTTKTNDSSLESNLSTKIELNQSSLKEYNLFGVEQKSVVGNQVLIDANNKVYLENSLIYLTNNQNSISNYYYLASSLAQVNKNVINFPQQAILFSLDPTSVFNLVNMFNSTLDLNNNTLSSKGPVNLLTQKVRMLAGGFNLNLKTNNLLLTNHSASFFDIKSANK